MLNVGVIGFGYWGPNIVRNFCKHSDCKVVAGCDKNPTGLTRVTSRHPGMAVTTDPDDIIGATDIDAVAIVTPVSCHYELAQRALENGKHVFVEKPFTATSAQAEE